MHTYILKRKYCLLAVVEVQTEVNEGNNGVMMNLNDPNTP